MKRLRFINMLFLVGCMVSTSCVKIEYVDVLKKNYDSTTSPSELVADFTVQLQGRALQSNEKGEWTILQGSVVEEFVSFSDKANPFATFKGLPGEEYKLQWAIYRSGVQQSVAVASVKIPDLQIEIKEVTPANYQTIRLLQVDPKYIGKWTFDKPYGNIFSLYHDGWSRPSDERPTIELHGYAQTSYKATYTTSYAGKTYSFTKEVLTGDYQEDEALQCLGLTRSSYRVVEDKEGGIIELDLQAWGTAHYMQDLNVYPSFRALKHLRKLILGGSTAKNIPHVIGECYLNLEDLSMDRVGDYLDVPENIGNLKKLRRFHLTPLRSISESRKLLLPKSFAKLTALNELIIHYAGMVDFNGTLGHLENLQHMECFVSSIPDDIGNLKSLSYLELIVENSYVPENLHACENLKFLRLMFQDLDSRRITLPSKIGNLKKLETLELTSKNIYSLPQSIGELSQLSRFILSGANIAEIPSSIGGLGRLQTMIIGGNYTILPDQIGNLKSLISLHLSPSIQKLPDTFGEMSALQYLDISSSKITTLPASIGKLKKLKEINAWQSQMKILPASFSNLDALEKVDFGYTQFQSFPESLVGLKSIHTIVLNGTTLNKLPDSIYQLREGVFIDVYQCKIDLDYLREIVKTKRGIIFKTDNGWIY